MSFWKSMKISCWARSKKILIEPIFTQNGCPVLHILCAQFCTTRVPEKKPVTPFIWGFSYGMSFWGIPFCAVFCAILCGFWVPFWVDFGSINAKKASTTFRGRWPQNKKNALLQKRHQKNPGWNGSGYEDTKVEKMHIFFPIFFEKKKNELGLQNRFYENLLPGSLFFDSLRILKDFSHLPAVFLPPTHPPLAGNQRFLVGIFLCAVKKNDFFWLF